MMTRKLALIAPLFVLTTAWSQEGGMRKDPAQGTTPSAQTPSKPMTAGKTSPNYYLTDLMGAPITNDKNERVGKVEDVVVQSNGDIGYVVVSYSGQEKLFAVPWNVFKVPPQGGDPKENLLQLPVGQDRLNQAPGFSKSEWPKMQGTSWLREVDTFYSSDARANPKRTAEAGMKMEDAIFKASSLKGLTIQNANKETVGTVQDVVIDPQSGQIGYLALNVGRYVGAGEKTIAYPWTGLKVTKTGEGDTAVPALTIDATKERLAAAPEFKAGREHAAEMTSPEMIRRVRESAGGRQQPSTPPNDGNVGTPPDREKPKREKPDEKKPDEKKPQ
jgi:sporulation protein YlmC with PRC-barrel domain